MYLLIHAVTTAVQINHREILGMDEQVHPTIWHKRNYFAAMQNRGK